MPWRRTGFHHFHLCRGGTIPDNYFSRTAGKTGHRGKRKEHYGHPEILHPGPLLDVIIRLGWMSASLRWEGYIRRW
jgi:hypothetical protein